MSRNITEINEYGVKESFTRYTKAELEAAWNLPYTNSPQEYEGHNKARARDGSCVVISCADKNKALIISAFFVRQMAMPSYIHWDGKTISLFCDGDLNLMERMKYFANINRRMDKKNWEYLFSKK